MTVWNQLAEELAGAGVSRAFGIPGSGASLSLIDALARRDVAFQTTHFEASAAIMAGTTARLAGGFGVAVSIKGPGLANLAPGLAACQFEALPVLGIAEAYPPDGPDNTVHKLMDDAGHAATVTKAVCILAEAGPGAAELGRFAQAERPGAVLLRLTASPQAAQPALPAATADDEAEGPVVLRWLKAAQRPAVIAGTLAVRQGWSAALNRLRIPVFSTAAAKGVVDETLPQCAGVYTGVGLELTTERQVLPQADLVVGLGLAEQELLAFPALQAPLVGIGCAASGPGRRIAFDDQVGVAQAAEVLEQLARSEWGLEEIARVHGLLADRLGEAGFLPAQAFSLLADSLGAACRMVLDTGYFCTIGEHAWRSASPELCLGSAQGRYMGVALPMAVAAALTDPGRPTVLAIGDGGIGMYLAELKIAVTRNLPLLTVLMSDGGFGSVRTRAIRDGLDQASLLCERPGWRDVVAGMGMPAERVDSAAGFADALARWQPAQGPMYIEAAFDPERYQHMVAGIR